jgi:hypothetical protein
MTAERPDTDERRDPGGTPSPGPGHLTDGPVVPGARGDEPKAVPGAYEADEAEQERGKAVKPGN